MEVILVNMDAFASRVSANAHDVAVAQPIVTSPAVGREVRQVTDRHIARV